MHKNRLESFSDCVLSIIITIMVLELKAPVHADFSALYDLVPTFLSYVLSFLFLAIYWNNHHHMLHTIRRVNGAILWGNIHLLFWLSLIPFAAAWLGKHPLASAPTALYGCVLLMSAASYTLLQRIIIHAHGADDLLGRALGNKDVKGKASLLIYCSAIGLAFIQPPLSHLLYLVVALLWVVPDKRIELVLKEHDTTLKPPA
jgi:uncharacterized membrane protein